MKKEQIVSQDPSVMHGTLVFAGTRVPVESLIQHLVAAGLFSFKNYQLMSVTYSFFVGRVER